MNDNKGDDVVERWYKNRIARQTAKRRANRMYAQLLQVLGGCCAACGTTGVNINDAGEELPCDFLSKLSIDHINNVEWDRSRLSWPTRVYRCWREYRNDVPLQVLCMGCNLKKGNRNSGLTKAKNKETDVVTREEVPF